MEFTSLPPPPESAIVVSSGTAGPLCDAQESAPPEGKGLYRRRLILVGAATLILVALVVVVVVVVLTVSLFDNDAVQSDPVTDTTNPPTPQHPAPIPPTTMQPEKLSPMSLQPSTLPPMTLSPTTMPPMTLQPTSARPSDDLLALLTSVSFDSGLALSNLTSQQHSAYLWLASNSNLSEYSNAKKISRYALATLYYSTSGYEWKSSSDLWTSQWLSDEDECDWHPFGDNCNINGEFSAMSLYDNHLVGFLPPELGLLSRLHYLYIVRNPLLSGSIPTEIGLLTDLVYLDLSENDLVGPIPTDIGFTNLSSLMLFNNSGVKGTIPSELGLVTSLQDLNLSGDSLSGTLPTEIGMLSLEYAILHNNELVGSIPSEIGLMSAMRVLDLSFNFLNGTIPTDIGLMTELNRLNVEDNDLTGSVPREICELVTLSSIKADCGEVVCSCCGIECQPKMPLDVAVYIPRRVRTCIIGNACDLNDQSSCIGLRNDSTALVEKFADDYKFRGVKTTSPDRDITEKEVCLELVLDDVQFDRVMSALELFRDNVHLWSHQDIELVLHILEFDLLDMDMSRWGGGVWIAPWNMREFVRERLTFHPDFNIAISSTRDPNLQLHHDLVGCGGSFGADFGVAGGGWSWIPESNPGFRFECAREEVITHEFLHQLHYSYQHLSGFHDIYGDSFPVCGEGGSDPHKWFPDTHQCNRDPDFESCGASECLRPDAHILGKHWDPTVNFVANHCKNGVQDYGESRVDGGGPCLDLARRRLRAVSCLQ